MWHQWGLSLALCTALCPCGHMSWASEGHFLPCTADSSELRQTDTFSEVAANNELVNPVGGVTTATNKHEAFNNVHTVF